MIYDLDHPV